MHMPKSRWRAFLIHLGLSLIIFLAPLYLIVFVWYPQPYFAADGGWHGIRIIVGVHLVLGPVLTLMVYRPGKRGLKLDLTLIALAQMAALAWGTSLVYQQRTVMVTYANGTFFTLNAEEVREAGGKAPQVLAASDNRPTYAYVRLPADKKERIAFVMRVVLSGEPLQFLGDRYEPLSAADLPEMQEQSLPIENYAKRSPKYRKALDDVVARHGGTAADYLFFPLSARYATLVVALRRSDGAVVDSLRIEPSSPHGAATSDASPPGK